MNLKKSITLKSIPGLNRQFIYYIIVILFFISTPSISYAQSHQVTQDPLRMRPNIVIAIGDLQKINSRSAKFKIIQIVAQGQGIVNPLSVGDEIIIKLNKDTKKLSGLKVEVYLREELGTDASRSKYMLIDASLH